MDRRGKLVLGMGIVAVVALLAMIPLKAADLKAGTEPVQPTRPMLKASSSSAHTVELLEVLRLWMLARELELSKEQSVEFIPTFEELQRVKQQFREDRQAMMRRLEEVDRRPAAPEEEMTVLQQRTDLEAGYWKEVQRLTSELNLLLTTRQQVKFALFNDTYRKKMSQLVNSLRQVGQVKQP